MSPPIEKLGYIESESESESEEDYVGRGECSNFGLQTLMKQSLS